LIKERLGQANQNLTVEIGNLNHKKNESREHIASLTESNKRDQDMLKKQFARLRTMLAQK
jgi:flagellar capping protein FliD